MLCHAAQIKAEFARGCVAEAAFGRGEFVGSRRARPRGQAGLSNLTGSSWFEGAVLVSLGPSLSQPFS